MICHHGRPRAAMPRATLEELSHKQIKALLARAFAIVNEEFSPEDHLPPHVLAFLRPIVDTTCQGFYSTTMMLLGAMAALTNGATVKLWSQKPTPLVALVFHIGDPQSGKSRLFGICEEVFDSCDDVISDHVKRMADDYEDERAAAAQGAELPALQPVTVKSITLQSFTFPEFFYRCSGEYPLLEFVEGDKRARSNFNQPVWFGRACNLDEAYEFFGDLGMLSTARSDKDKGSPSTNASTLNTLIACGKTRRATRSSTNFGAARGKTVSVSVLGNAHPNKFIPMERGLLGNHTACTKERFTVCLDAAAPRHAALSRDSTVKAGTSPWTWLPLTPQQAHAFGWEKFFNQPNKAREGRLPEDQASIEGEGRCARSSFRWACGGIHHRASRWRRVQAAVSAHERHFCADRISHFSSLELGRSDSPPQNCCEEGCRTLFGPSTCGPSTRCRCSPGLVGGPGRPKRCRAALCT